MYRSAINTLLQWKNKDNRKPLIIMGARQVGKTYLVNKFADREYKRKIYVKTKKQKERSNAFRVASSALKQIYIRFSIYRVFGIRRTFERQRRRNNLCPKTGYRFRAPFRRNRS